MEPGLSTVVANATADVALPICILRICVRIGINLKIIGVRHVLPEVFLIIIMRPSTGDVQFFFRNRNEQPRISLHSSEEPIEELEEDIQ